MKILIGGSPCTHWSIAQTKNRETEASGIGWELFLNYRIARDKYHPDYFLYENNKSMSPAIRAQITAELGVEPVEVLSMYDGMSCGHIALDKLGVDVTAYYATEIDKYAIQTTQHNFPDTVQLGDAFQVRDEEWRPRRAEESGVMDCYDCKAKSVCAAVVQPGSVLCLMNRMRYCGTHAEEEPRRQRGDYCQYCGHRLREIGRERFCNNVNCRNRYVNV